MKFYINMNNTKIDMYIENNVYKTIIENVVIEAVDIVILNTRQQILLWKRENPPLLGEFYIFWGRRYKNELLLDSVKRKISEEVWISAQENKLVFLWIYDDIYPNSIFDNTPSHYSSITYIYQLSDEEGKKIKKDPQHEELRFFDINSPLLHPAIKLRLKDMIDKNFITK